jgi:c-di-GMP-binding flagellar brake protein YcgR
MPRKTRRSGSERRTRPRADAKLSMMVEVPPDDGTPQQVVTESQNISSSGVYCTSSHFLAPMSKVALTIVLPRLGATRGKELIQCEGIVVRCQPLAKRGERRYELACMFSDMDKRRREMLEAFVTWRNLQALRAATRPVRATRPAAARTSPTRKATPRAAAARSTSRPKRTTRTSSTRRRTVH